MINNIQQITYGTYIIQFSLERTSRKTLEISVCPDRSVKVIAPWDTVLEAIQIKVKKRASWILKQLHFFEQFYPKKQERYYLSGESHLYLGKEYCLKIKRDIQKGVFLAHNVMLVQSHTPERSDITRHILEKWYVEQAKIVLKKRVEACLLTFPDQLFFKPKSIIIRQLLNRWGSMTKAGNLVLNRQLIKASIQSIDYVITHELCHIKHPNHSESFYNLLERIMPDWKKYKLRLEKILS